MLKLAGRYVWWALGLFFVSLLLLIYFRSRPHLHAGPATTISDIKEIISGLAALVGGVVSILGFIDKWFFKTAEDKRPDYGEDRPRRGNRPVVGQQRERVIGYEGDYEVISVQTFDGYDRGGRERWRLDGEFRRPRRLD